MMIRKRVASLKTVFYSDLSIRFGIGIGIFGLLFSLLVRSLMPVRMLGDPLPILLILSQLLRGVAQGIQYIHWQSLFLHFLYMVILGLGAIGGNRLVKGWTEASFDPIRATRIAIAVNVVTIAFVEIDSVLVGLWYLAAGYLSFSLAGVITRALSQIVVRRSRKV